MATEEKEKQKEKRENEVKQTKKIFYQQIVGKDEKVFLKRNIF